jgi:hypothetical protein
MQHKGETVFWQGSPVPDPTMQDENPPELPELSREASVVLYSLSAVFPFDFFPDKLIIRLNHVDIIHEIFFWSGATDRIQIIDIRDVSVQYNPIFATLILTPAGAANPGLRIRYLWKNQAMRAKRILLGILECHRQQVDLSKHSKRDILAYVEKIGRAKEV